MNQLDPELKRLMRWARQAPEPAPAEMPFGFSSRVLAAMSSSAPMNELASWQSALWRCWWAAATVIVLGLAMLVGEEIRQGTFYTVPPLYQVVSANLVP